MRNVLLLADRHADGAWLQYKISKVRPCRFVSIHDVTTDIPDIGLIVADVALDNEVLVKFLRLALERHRAANTPLLCLVKNKTHQTRTQAYAIGATDVLLADSPTPVLIRAITKLMDPNDRSADTVPDDSDEAFMLRSVQEAGAALTDIMDAAGRDAAIAPDVVAAGAASVLEACRRFDIRAWLDIVWNYDDVTYQHCLLVTGLAAAFAIKLGFNAADCQRLTSAALLHDIGKAKIPVNILNKPGRLTDDEMKIIRTHAEIGANLLAEQGGFEDDIVSVVRHHHEHLDGAGYPDGLHAADIPDIVRLTTICDIYAALIERRSYKEPMSPDSAFAILQDMKGKLDPDLTAFFHNVMLDCRGGESTPPLAQYA